MTQLINDEMAQKLEHEIAASLMEQIPGLKLHEASPEDHPDEPLWFWHWWDLSSDRRFLNVADAVFDFAAECSKTASRLNMLYGDLFKNLVELNESVAAAKFESKTKQAGEPSLEDMEATLMQLTGLAEKPESWVVFLNQRYERQALFPPTNPTTATELASALSSILGCPQVLSPTQIIWAISSQESDYRLKQTVSQSEQKHREAMNLYAKVFNMSGHHEAQLSALSDAYMLEREAALMLVDLYSMEPSRSVMFRSAGELALECGAAIEAERLASLGLTGSPPAEIAVELRSVMERAWKLMQDDLPMEAEQERAGDRPVVANGSNIASISMILSGDYVSCRKDA